MKTKTLVLKAVSQSAKKRTYKTLDEAVQAKSEAMEILFTDADWSTLKRPRA